MVNETSKDQSANFESYLKSNKNSINEDNTATLTRCLRELQNSKSSGARSNELDELSDISPAEKASLLKSIDNSKTSSLVSLYSALIEDEQNEEWQANVKKIEDKILENSESLSSGEITRIVYVLNQLNRDSHELWSILEEETLDKLEKFSLNHLITVLACFAGQGIGSEELFMQIDRRLGLGIQYVKPLDLPIMVYFFALSGKYRKKFFFMAQEHIIKNMPSYDISEMVKILWAYVNSNTLNTALYNILEAEISNEITTIAPEDLNLLLESVIGLNEDGGKLASFLLPTLREICRVIKTTILRLMKNSQSRFIWLALRIKRSSLNCFHWLMTSLFINLVRKINHIKLGCP